MTASPRGLPSLPPLPFLSSRLFFAGAMIAIETATVTVTVTEIVAVTATEGAIESAAPRARSVACPLPRARPRPPLKISLSSRSSVNSSTLSRSLSRRSSRPLDASSSFWLLRALSDSVEMVDTLMASNDSSLALRWPSLLRMQIVYLILF